MADLIDRIIGVDGVEKIAVHHFIAQYRMVSEGIRTGAEVVAEFDLVDQEITDANAVLTELNSQSNITNKMRYVLKLDAVFISIEAGDSRYWPSGISGEPDKATIKADLGISQ